MAPIGVACQAMPRWLTTPLAASPASFQPSNPTMATGAVSSPMSLNSMALHLPKHHTGGLEQDYVVGSTRWVTCGVSYARQRNLGNLGGNCLHRGPDEHTTSRVGRTRGGCRRGDGYHAPGQRRQHR